MQARWEGDDRGRGVANGARMADGLRELTALANTENWVTEAPDRHLLPHLVQACDEPGSFFDIESSETDAQGALIVRLRCHDPSAGLGQIRAAIYTLVGEVAEPATYIRQRDDPLEFEMLTGSPAGDGPFASHGHVLILRMT